MTDAAAIRVDVPPGRWLVGVSGGADSTALALLAARAAPDRVVVAHLDHKLRGPESDADAAFVAGLAERLGVPAEIGRRDAVERTLAALPLNPQARYRVARLTFFGRVRESLACDGVLLAHHADDQAETVLLRLLRGRCLTGLGGMRADTRVDGLRVVRPLLGVRRERLRAWLVSAGQAWREDASNASFDYRRNVARRLLEANPMWTPMLLRVTGASAGLRDRVEAAAPRLDASFDARPLRGSPIVLEHAVRRWLIDRGAPADRVSPDDCRRLLRQATDVTHSSRRHYPGGLLVRRRAGRVDVMPSPPVQSPHPHGQEATRAQDL